MKHLLLLIALIFIGCEPRTTTDQPTLPEVTEVKVGMTISNTIDRLGSLKVDCARKYSDRGKQVTKGTFPRDMVFTGTGAEKIDYDTDKTTWGLEARSRQIAQQVNFVIHCEEHIYLHEKGGVFAEFFRKQYHLADWGNTEEKALAKLSEYCERVWPALDGNIHAYQPYNEFWLTNAKTEEEGRANYQKMLRTIVNSFTAYDWKQRPMLITPPLPLTPAGTMWDDGFIADYIPEDLRDDFKAVTFHAYAIRPRQEGDPAPNRAIIWEKDTRLAKAIIDQADDWRKKYIPKAELWATEIGFPNRINTSMTNEPIWEDTEQYAKEHIQEVINYGATKGMQRAIIFEAFHETTNYLYEDTFILDLEEDTAGNKTISKIMAQGVLVDSLRLN